MLFCSAVCSHSQQAAFKFKVEDFRRENKELIERKEQLVIRQVPLQQPTESTGTPRIFLDVFIEGLVARRLLWNRSFLKKDLEKGFRVRLKELECEELGEKSKFEELRKFAKTHMQPAYRWAWVDFLRFVRKEAWETCVSSELLSGVLQSEVSH